MRKIGFGRFTALAAVVSTGLFGLVLAGTVAPAWAQGLDDEGPGSWWATPDEPDMVRVEGTLRAPETIRVELGGGREIRGWEALVFLMARHYVDHVVVGGQTRLVTTGKYRAWRAAHLRPTPPPPVGIGASGPSSAGPPPGGPGAGAPAPGATPSVAPVPPAVTAGGAPAASAAVFRLSGGIDPDHRAAVAAKAAAAGNRLAISGDPITFEFVPGPGAPGSGLLVMKPPTVTFDWTYGYSTGMVDRLSATCSLKDGGYSVLSPGDPVAMIGGWGGVLVCDVTNLRDGRPMPGAGRRDVPLMIEYDRGRRAWKVIAVGLQDAVWRLQ